MRNSRALFKLLSISDQSVQSSINHFDHYPIFVMGIDFIANAPLNDLFGSDSWISATKIRDVIVDTDKNILRLFYYTQSVSLRFC